MLPQPGFFETMHFSTLSPVVITQVTDENKYEQYLKPDDNDYEPLFFKNMLDKHNAYAQSTDAEGLMFENQTLKFACLTKKPVSRLQTIKAHANEELKVRGYLKYSATAANQNRIRKRFRHHERTGIRVWGNIYELTNQS